MQSYDTIIIGAGQAGGPLAHNLADRGWKVALIERQHLGGSCINYGCTPTKKMIASAQVAQTVRRAGEYGVKASAPEVDLAEVIRLKDELVRSFREGKQNQIDRRPNITLYRGEARFNGPYIVEVNGEQLTADKIFINTGTRPALPPVEGIENIPYLTNNSILELTQLPEHLLVMGGSYQGLEFGQMFRRFGSRVTVIEYNNQIVSREDPDIAQALCEALQKEGMAFKTGWEVQNVEPHQGGALQLTLRSRQNGNEAELIGSHLLIGTGRQPNSEALNLPATGIETNRGWIQTNEYLETNVPGIYALGDIRGGPAFTHISYDDFQIALHNLFNEDKHSIDDRLVPYTLYTDPELGRVGLTEKEALEKGYRIKVGTIPMDYVARAIEMNRTEGMMKLVVDASTDLILGAAILSVHGGELVQTLMALMMVGASWKVFHRAIFIHPTLTEGFFSLMNAVEQAEIKSPPAAP